MINPRPMPEDGFLPCDVVFTSGHQWYSRLIRWGSQMYGEQRTFAGHVGGFKTKEIVLEALSRVVSHPYAEAFEGKLVEVWRYLDLTDDDREKIVTEAVKFEGSRYGWWKLLAHAIDKGCGKLFRMDREPNWTKEWIGWDKRPICNYVWAAAYEKGIGYQFGRDYEETDPDQMHDFVRVEAGWVRVYISYK